MSQDAVERFLGRIITDRAFRERAANSLESATAKEGIFLSPEEKALLKGIDLTLFEQVAETLDDCLRRN